MTKKDAQILGANCSACPLKNARFAPSEFKTDTTCTIIGESPGRIEVMQQKPFVGPSGNLLWSVLQQFSLQREDCNITNTILCLPPYVDKQEIVEQAAICCKPRLLNELTINKLGYICTLGMVARNSIFPVTSNASKKTLHSCWTYLPQFETKAISTLHPAYVLRKPNFSLSFFEHLERFATGIRDTKVTEQPKTPGYVIAPSMETVETWLEAWIALPEGSVFSFDLEADQLSWMYEDILLMTVSITADRSFIIPKDLLYLSAIQHKDLWEKLWQRQDIEFIAHNGKFDLKFLRYQLDMKSAKVTYDTMLAHYALDERSGVHGLKGLCASLLNIPDYETDLGLYIPRKKDKWSKVPFDVLAKYASQDSVYPILLREIFMKRMDSAEKKLFYELLMPFSELALQTELAGVLIDQLYLVDLHNTFEKQCRQLADEMFIISGGVIENPNSTKQVAIYLYDVLGLVYKPKGKAKKRSTDKTALAQLQGRHFIIDKLILYRRVAKLKSSYVTNLLNFCDDRSVVHWEVQIHGTETGRISATKPALQTIPRADNREVGQYGKLVKDAFIARPGMVLVAVDFSQAELRVATGLSRDKFLTQVYEDGRDLHTEVAVEMFGEDYTKTQRTLCKSFNFSYLYGGSAHSFAGESGFSLKKAKEFVANYDSVTQGLAEWKQKQVDTMFELGEVVTPIGRKRRIPLITKQNEDDSTKASFNAPIQGMASDITLFAAIATQKYLQTEWQGSGAQVLLFVHDSVITEVPEEHSEEIAKHISQIAVDTALEILPQVKWKADSEIGKRWGSLK